MSLSDLEKLNIVKDNIGEICCIEDVMRLIGYEIIASKRFSVYSGDELIVYKKDDLFHIYVGAFGSCSYCDEVIDCVESNNYQRLFELATTNTVYVGETLSIAIEKLKENSWCNVWDSMMDEFLNWLYAIEG